MSTDAGSIKYTVETDTSSQLKADKIVDRSTKRMESSFKQVDNVVKKTTETFKNSTAAINTALASQNRQLDKATLEFKEFEAQITSASGAIHTCGQVTNNLRKVDKELTTEARRLKKAIREEKEAIKKLNGELRVAVREEKAFALAKDKASRASSRQSKSLSEAEKALKKTSRGLGQAGIQVQQFVGQVQLGTNPMIAFSQQSTDLGFVLGFPLLGAIAGISATLAGVLMPALFGGETAVGRLQKVMESLRETAITTDDGITLLSAGIEKLAKKSRVAAGIEIELAMKKARSAIIDAKDSINDAAGEWAGFGQGTSLLNQQFATAERASKRLGKTVREIVTGAAIEQEGLVAGIFGIEEATKIREAVASTAEEFKISKDSALDLLIAINQFKNGRITMEEFSGAALAVSRANLLTSDSFKKLLETSGKSTASASEATDILKVLEMASKDLDKALTESSEGGFKKQKAAADTLSDALERMFETEERLDEARARRDAADKARLERQVAATGISPLQALIVRQATEVEILKQGFEQKIIAEQEFLDRSAELNRQHQEQVQSLNKKTTEKSAIDWQTLENQVVGTLGSIVVGAQSGKEAMAGLARTVLTQMVGALIKMGIQAIIGQTAAAAAGVATAATLATAYAPAAALASLASFGANAAPAAAGMTATVALGQALALSGSREHGGPVSAGKSFLVGERGAEVFTPNQSGRIASNKDSFGGGGGFEQTVIIENNTPANVSTQTSDDGRQMRIIINEVANQINTNQGAIPRAMRQSTNTTFRTSR